MGVPSDALHHRGTSFPELMNTYRPVSPPPTTTACSRGQSSRQEAPALAPGHAFPYGVTRRALLRVMRTVLRGEGHFLPYLQTDGLVYTL